MDKFLPKIILALVLMVFGLKSTAKPTPKYSYILEYAYLDTNEYFIGLNVGVRIVNNRKFKKKTPLLQDVTHLSTRKEKDYFAKASNIKTDGYAFGNISYFITDSLGNKYFFNRAGANYNRGFPFLSYIKLNGKQDTLIHYQYMYFILALEDNGDIRNSGVIGDVKIQYTTDGGFWTKPIIGVGKASQLVPINNLTKLYCEFRIKGKKYDLNQGVLFGKPK